MQTVKEETLGILKKLKALKAEKTKLTKEFRAHKDRNAALKKELEHSLAEYEVSPRGRRWPSLERLAVHTRPFAPLRRRPRADPPPSSPAAADQGAGGGGGPGRAAGGGATRH